MKFPITHQQLTDWANEQPDDAVVGHRGDPDDCPCQRCMVEITGKQWSVTYIYSTSDDIVYRMPIWMRQLVVAIDATRMTIANDPYAVTNAQLKDCLLSVVSLVSQDE